MELLGKLGIDINLLLAQLVNFAILLWLLSKFVYKPLIKQIEKDEVALKQSRVESAKLAKEKEKFAELKKQENLKNKRQAQKIIDEAEALAERIKDKAQIETEKERQAVIKQIKSYLSELKNEK